MEEWTTIRYLRAQGKGVRAISKELGVGRNTVRRAVRADQPPRYQRPERPNPKLEPFEARIQSWYYQDHLIGSRILRELEPLGYQGGPTALYRYLKTLKSSLPSSKVTERFETAPGQQGQFDWSPYTLEISGELKRVIVYGLTLGYSRRKHYTASLDETQASIFEALEAGFCHFGGAPKEVLVDNARSFVADARPEHFQWNRSFLELCGHYRVQPRACKVYRARTKGKVERPFFFLEQQFIKGRTFSGWLAFLHELATFEREVLDVEVHHTTQQRPIERFADEQPLLVPLPETRFVGTLAETRKVSWDCTISYGGTPYSVPAHYAGKLVWVLVSQGRRLIVRDSKRQEITSHDLSPIKGQPVINPAHYESLRRGQPRTMALLTVQFLARFPGQQRFLDGLVAQHRMHPEAHLRPILELAEGYDDASCARAFGLAHEYVSYSHAFVRGLLERDGQPRLTAATSHQTQRLSTPETVVRADLGRYQQLLEQS